MASGRFDSQKIVYLAGRKARERGRDKSGTNTGRYEKLEVLRTKMAECQTDFLAPPEDYPDILQGKEEEWSKTKREYDQLLRAGKVEEGGDGGKSNQNQSEHVSNAAIRAVKSHIHNAIVYAGNLSK